MNFYLEIHKLPLTLKVLRFIKHDSINRSSTLNRFEIKIGIFFVVTFVRINEPPRKNNLKFSEWSEDYDLFIYLETKVEKCGLRVKDSTM